MADGNADAKTSVQGWLQHRLMAWQLAEPQPPWERIVVQAPAMGGCGGGAYRGQLLRSSPQLAAALCKPWRVSAVAAHAAIRHTQLL